MKNYMTGSLILGLAVLDIAAFLPPYATASAASAVAAGKVQNSQTIGLLQAPLAFAPSLPAKGGGGIAIVDNAALVSDSGPGGTAADIPDRDPSTEISAYVVRSGDTLGSIAEMFGVSVNTLIWANDLASKTIAKDQVLVILPISGIQHKVAKGDTIESIAKKYKTDIGEILQYNDIGLHDALAVGDVIIVPDAELDAPAASVPSAAKKKAAATAIIRGVGGPRIAGYYGVPIVSAHRTQGLHGYNGVDLGTPVGTTVLASASGSVIIAKSGGYNGGYGSYIVISHENGTQTLYGHLSQVNVSVGQSVSRGQSIGLSGNTGHSTGPHLHFEIRGAVNFCADADNPCSTY